MGTKLPKQSWKPKELVFSAEEGHYVQQELNKILDKGIIRPVVDEVGQYVSNIFLRPKKDGSHRVILTLKQLNTDIEHYHFKMETLTTAFSCIYKNAWFAFCDLKDAYYSIQVDHRYRKFLRFSSKNQLYEYTCLPNGLTTAPRVFTKVLKVVFSQLRKWGHLNVAYIDDSLLISRSYLEAKINTTDTVKLLYDLGFTINPTKSVLEPTQVIEFLGFTIDSRTMRIKLTERKAIDIIEMCSKFIKKRQITIRDFAKLIGKLIASQPGVDYAPLYIKTLEISKDYWLKKNKGNFDTYMPLSGDNIVDLTWWVNNV